MMTPVKAYAAQNAAAPLAPFTISRRTPGDHDVAIDILYCGVCHTDIHFVRNDLGMSLYPLVPGHEIVGRVSATGARVEKVKVGDIAGVGCLVDSCRTCSSCERGLEQYCENGFVLTYSSLERDGVTVTQGGYSGSIVVDDRFVLKVPESMPLAAVAPLLCAGITTYSPLRYWRVEKGHRVAVVGLGGLGHMAVKFAAAMGAEVSVLSTSPSKAADATRLGAQEFVLTSDEDRVKACAGRFDIVLDTVSGSHDYNAYVAMLRASGVLVCLGVAADPLQVPPLSLVFTRKSVAGSLIGGLPETQEMLDFCAARQITADVEVIAMQEINRAYERILAGDVKYRFVIDMGSLTR
jgi:alcohol dehydrogenase (NADP+)